MLARQVYQGRRARWSLRKWNKCEHDHMNTEEFGE